MASILSAGTTNSTALNLTADTSGSLILASNNNVTAVTIATNQSVTFANNATFPTTIGVGGATPSASGSGITFPATQSASTNANTLDDYEEGTWTPAYDAQGGTPSVTYGTRTGRYVKTGQTVNVWLYISISAFSGGTGYLTVTGLPFTNGDVQGGLNSNWSNAAWTTVFPAAGHIGSSTSSAYMVYYNGASTSQIQFSNLANGCELTMFGSYKASA